MEEQFAENQKVEALDTVGAVWRLAIIHLISHLTVAVSYPGWKNKNKLHYALDITEEMVAQPQRWPIRAETQLTFDDLVKPRPKRVVPVTLPKLPANLVSRDQVGVIYVYIYIYTSDVTYLSM